MKALLIVLALVSATAPGPALADKIEWTCEGLNAVKCPADHDKKLDNCQASNGIDTFLEKAGKKANKCRLSKVVVAELCYSGFEPAKFELTCEDKEDENNGGDEG
jgi:hypothetical protein